MMRVKIAVAAVFGLVVTGALIVRASTAAAPITEWEHGFKTDRIVATRYKNPVFGYNIGFRYISVHDDLNDRQRRNVPRRMT